MTSTAAIIFLGLILVGANAQWYGHSDSDSDEPEISSRISNGKDANRTQFPYQVALQLHTTDGPLLCGGSIISKNWIVSAAHCFQIVPTDFDVYLGAWSVFDPEEKGQQIIHNVPRKNVIVHEDWDLETVRNDIALIKMPKTIKFNEYIQKINLPKISSSYPTYAGEYAIASGYGKIDDDGNFADVLQWIVAPVMKNSDCKLAYPDGVVDSTICIDTKGAKSTCGGDSGGPLVLAGDNPILIGITSFGNKTCETGDPAAFTRVTSYLGWIKKHTGIKGH